MATETKAFRDFEQAGWANSDVCQTYHKYFAELTTQSVGALLDAANVTAKSSVLDIACGAGYAVGAAVARGATATGVDFSPAMVAMARERYPSIAFKEADADNLPFQDSTFDAVVNNFGTPHLPDPEAATREAFRVLKPSGRFAFSVWDVPQKALAFGAIYGAMQAYGNLSVPLPTGPNFFLLSNSDQCKANLTQAGFLDPQIEYHLLVLRVPDPDMVFDGIAGGTVRVAALLKAQETEVQAKVKQAVNQKIASTS